MDLKILDRIAKDNEERQLKPKPNFATVSRIDGDKIYVVIDGDAEEFPSGLSKFGSVSCEEGDRVRIARDNGAMYISDSFRQSAGIPGPPGPMPPLADNLTTTEKGLALDASQGKILNDIIVNTTNKVSVLVVPYSGYKIVYDNTKKVNDVLYLSVSISRVDDSYFTPNANIILGELPFIINSEYPLNTTPVNLGVGYVTSESLCFTSGKYIIFKTLSDSVNKVEIGGAILL